jgi:hypothetical protein
MALVAAKQNRKLEANVIKIVDTLNSTYWTLNMKLFPGI